MLFSKNVENTIETICEIFDGRITKEDFNRCKNEGLSIDFVLFDRILGNRKSIYNVSLLFNKIIYNGGLVASNMTSFERNERLITFLREHEQVIRKLELNNLLDYFLL